MTQCLATIYLLQTDKQADDNHAMPYSRACQKLGKG